MLILPDDLIPAMPKGNPVAGASTDTTSGNNQNLAVLRTEHESYVASAELVLAINRDSCWLKYIKENKDSMRAAVERDSKNHDFFNALDENGNSLLYYLLLIEKFNLSVKYVLGQHIFILQQKVLDLLEHKSAEQRYLKVWLNEKLDELRYNAFYDVIDIAALTVTDNGVLIEFDLGVLRLYFEKNWEKFSYFAEAHLPFCRIKDDAKHIRRAAEDFVKQNKKEFKHINCKKLENATIKAMFDCLEQMLVDKPAEKKWILLRTLMFQLSVLNTSFNVDANVTLAKNPETLNQVVFFTSVEIYMLQMQLYIESLDANINNLFLNAFKSYEEFLEYFRMLRFGIESCFSLSDQQLYLADGVCQLLPYYPQEQHDKPMQTMSDQRLLTFLAQLIMHYSALFQNNQNYFLEPTNITRYQQDFLMIERRIKSLERRWAEMELNPIFQREDTTSIFTEAKELLAENMRNIESFLAAKKTESIRNHEWLPVGFKTQGNNASTAQQQQRKSSGRRRKNEEKAVAGAASDRQNIDDQSTDSSVSVAVPDQNPIAHDISVMPQGFSNSNTANSIVIKAEASVTPEISSVNGGSSGSTNSAAGTAKKTNRRANRHKKLVDERHEKEKLKTTRLEAERLEAERLEAERLETERLEAERLEAERLEAERLEAERLEAERLEAERLAAERLEAERLEAERLEAERLAAERLEAERLEAEKQKVERQPFAPLLVSQELAFPEIQTFLDELRDGSEEVTGEIHNANTHGVIGGHLLKERAIAISSLAESWANFWSTGSLPVYSPSMTADIQTSVMAKK